MQKPTNLFVVVNYFMEEEVSAFFLNEVLKQNCDSWCLVIVNNGSYSWSSLQQLEKQGVHLIDPPENTGYLGAAGKALDYFIEKFEASPALLVLSNSDMSYLQKDTLKYWNERYSDATGIGMVGCRITSTHTGKAQNPMYPIRLKERYIKNLIQIFENRFVYFIYQTASLLKGKLLSFKKDKSMGLVPKPVYAVHGSCMVMLRSLISLEDTFCDAPFLFGEELYLAELCHRENLQVIFDPKQEILHQEHQTTGVYKSLMQRKRLADSLILILRKFYSNL
jgi:hypothetical protein